MIRKTWVFIFLAAISVALPAAQTAATITEFPQVSATVARRSVRMGEPVVFQLVCKFAVPQTSPGDPNAVLATRMLHADVQIGKSNGSITTAPLLPYIFYRQDTDGLVYSGSFVLFYDHFEHKLLFDTPGRYTIAIEGFVRPIEVTVTSQESSDSEMPYKLLQPNDFALLEHGSSGHAQSREEAVLRLAEVASKFPDSELGRWANARLGLEYSQALAQLQSGVEPKYLAASFQLTKDELLIQAKSHLASAEYLRDEFPLREEALYTLAAVEARLGNRERSKTLLHEVGLKYPSGKFGRMALWRSP